MGFTAVWFGVLDWTARCASCGHTHQKKSGARATTLNWDYHLASVGFLAILVPEFVLGNLACLACLAFCRIFAVGCPHGTHYLDDALSFAVLPCRSHSLSCLMHRHGFLCCIVELLRGARHLRVYVSLCSHVNWFCTVLLLCLFFLCDRRLYVDQGA